jgi:DNA mismatch repair protein MutL
MGRIHLLHPEIISKIAAGEVVERPASVVKELVENALDAKAQNIRVELLGGGRKLIRVIDDGEGMDPEDARRALERHTTSKIEKEEDLWNILSFGFRGEALFSISAVSRFRLLTKTANALTGWEIKAEAGLIQSEKEAGCSKGTLVEVQDLFFNIPARLKFLKSPGIELSHISDIMAKMALANPSAHLQLYREGKILANYPVRETFLSRLAEALGREAAERMHFFQSRNGSRVVKGYAGDPGLTRPNSRGIFLFVNRRPIRDRLVFRAVIDAYGNRIPKSRYPVVVLFLEIPPQEVDVNVHPGKWEVKFSDSDSIYRLILFGIQGLLEKKPWGNEEKSFFHMIRESGDAYGKKALHFQRNAGNFGQLGKSIPLSDEIIPSEKKLSFSLMGQIENTYLLFHAPDGLILMDQHAAHERILFERLQRELTSGGVTRQQLLLPEMLECHDSEVAQVEEHSSDLLRLGFEIELSGNRTFWVRTVPEILTLREPIRALKEIIHSLPLGDPGTQRVDPAFQAQLQVMACHGAIPAGQRVGPEEAVALLTALQKCQSPSYCPHGRPTMKKFTVFDLEKMFGRRK